LVRHRAARWLVIAGTGLTLIGCRQGIEPSAAPAPQASVAWLTLAEAPAGAVAPELIAVVEAAPETTTTSTTTTAPPPTTAAPEPPPTTAAPDPEPAPAPPPRRVRVAAAAAVESAPAQLPAPVPPINTAAAAEFTGRTNSLRSSVGLPALVRDGSLDALAAGWARELASSGQLRHSSIPRSIVGQPWSVVGENVGFGPSAAAVHEALVASAGHYANLVGARYSRCGMAVATDVQGQLWVVELFAG
jgi:uncharacterized protein YkwD